MSAKPFVSPALLRPLRDWREAWIERLEREESQNGACRCEPNHTVIVGERGLPSLQRIPCPVCNKDAGNGDR